YRAGEWCWYSDRAHYRPVFWLADDLPGDRPRRVATGTALASGVGIPIGRIIGQYFGWRMTFLAIGLGA
ncbi:hypothetical protein CQA86_32720, partial [Klebsiella pneumoniae]